MSKRAKKRNTQIFPLPLAARVSVASLALATLSWYYFSQPATVHPTRVSSVRPTPRPKPIAHRLPVPAPRPAAATTAAISAPQVEVPKSPPLPGRFDRQIVDYASDKARGTVVIDTGNTFLYLVLNSGQAIRYGIGVGREGFTWSGEQSVSRKAEWPDWHPPADMLARQPYLPRFMAGGPGNPLGARAMYLGETEYRIHGTNDPSTIGKRVSSGCIRLTNDDIADLYSRVKIGAKVIVLPASVSGDRPMREPLAGTAIRVLDRVTTGSITAHEDFE